MSEKNTVDKTDTSGLYDTLVLKSSSGAGWVNHSGKLYQVAQDVDNELLFIEFDLYNDLLASTSMPTSKGKTFSFGKLKGES